MEHIDVISRKRTYSSGFPQMEETRSYQNYDDYPLEERLQGLKRPRCGPIPPLFAGDFTAFYPSDDCHLDMSNAYFLGFHTQQDIDTSCIYNGFCTTSSLSAPFNNHTVEYDCLPWCQDMAITNNGPDTPAPYIMTNTNLSPDSLQTQSVQSPCVIMSGNPIGGGEPPHAGSKEFFLSPEDHQSDQLGSHQITFDNADAYDFPTLHDLSDLFPEMANNHNQSQFMSNSVNVVYPHAETRIHYPSTTTGISQPSNIGLPNQGINSTRPMMPDILQAPYFRPIQQASKTPLEFNEPLLYIVPYELSPPQQCFSQKSEPKQPGRRTKSLDQEVAEHARKMRKHRACWPCRISKTPCTFGDPCKRCSKPSIPPKVCYRLILVDFRGSFTPDLVYSRLSESNISDYKRKNIDFTRNAFNIEMTSGPNYPPISLIVTEFRPLSQDALDQNVVTSKENAEDESFEFIQSYAAPLGIDDTRTGGLTSICLDHIKLIIEQERDFGEASMGDISVISWKLFEAVNKYRRSKVSKNARLLKKAAMLHAMHYFMSRIILLSNESTEKAIEHLRRPHSLKFTETPTCTLLNMQIKQAMQRILADTTTKVLEELDSVLARPRAQRSTWPDMFCVVLILCICIEAVQVASDSYAMAALRKDPNYNISRSSVCRELDERPFKYITELFHMVYKTRRVSPKNRIGFNPIRMGLKVNVEEGITLQMVELVKDVQGIIEQHGDEMCRVAEDPTFDSKRDILACHMAFRRRNSGRLVSKFLMTFR